MDPLGDPLITRPIRTGWEFAIEPYPNWRFGFIDNPDRQFGNGSGWTRTRTRTDGPEPLLTLPGGRETFNFPSDGTRFSQSRQSRLEHPRVSDGNYSCCWWAYTQYSIHPIQHSPSTVSTRHHVERVQHQPSTASTKYSVDPVLHWPCRA